MPNAQASKQKGRNVLTKELREALKDLLATELESVPDLLNKLEPRERLDVLTKLLPYVMPKVETVRADWGEIDWSDPFAGAIAAIRRREQEERA